MKKPANIRPGTLRPRGYWIAFALLLLSCGGEDAVTRCWRWEGRFRGTDPAFRIRIRQGFTNSGGRRLARTEINWEQERVNRVESVMAKDVRYTILANAGLTIVSNSVIWLETPEGRPVSVRYRVRSVFRNAKAYWELLRKRLDELFVKHFGAAASGRARFVEEQLNATLKGELASLPDRELLWTLEKGGWRLRGHDQDKKVDRKAPLPRRLLFPGGLLRTVRGLSGKPFRAESALLLPWYSTVPKTFVLTASAASNGFSCSLQHPTNAALSCTVSFTTGFRPRSVRVGEKVLLPYSAAAVR